MLAAVLPPSERVRARVLRQRAAQVPDRVLIGADQLRQACIGEAGALEFEQALRIECGKTLLRNDLFGPHQFLDLTQEPMVDEAEFVDLRTRQAGAEGIGDGRLVQRPERRQIGIVARCNLAGVTDRVAQWRAAGLIPAYEAG